MSILQPALVSGPKLIKPVFLSSNMLDPIKKKSRENQLSNTQLPKLLNNKIRGLFLSVPMREDVKNRDAMGAASGFGGFGLSNGPSFFLFFFFFPS